MATDKFLDYQGLAHVLDKINERYAPIQAIVYKGTAATISMLPPISEVKAGWMYNVTTGGTTTSDFVEGPDHPLQNGENVVAVNVRNTGTPLLRWDIVGGIFDIEDRLQFGSEFPSDPKNGDTFLYLGNKVYDYRRVIPVPGDNPAEEGWYESDGSGGYERSRDTSPVEGKNYYIRYEKYLKGVIYVYNYSGDEWIAQPSGDTITSISISDINALFN